MEKREKLLCCSVKWKKIKKNKKRCVEFDACKYRKKSGLSEVMSRQWFTISFTADVEYRITYRVTLKHMYDTHKLREYNAGSSVWLLLFQTRAHRMKVNDPATVDGCTVRILFMLETDRRAYFCNLKFLFHEAIHSSASKTVTAITVLQTFRLKVFNSFNIPFYPSSVIIRAILLSKNIKT